MWGETGLLADLVPAKHCANNGNVLGQDVGESATTELAKLCKGGSLRVSRFSGFEGSLEHQD